MSTQTDTDELDVPTKITVDADLEVPAHIWDVAEQRAATADGDLQEYLLDHLMIDYQFTRVD